LPNTIASRGSGALGGWVLACTGSVCCGVASAQPTPTAPPTLELRAPQVVFSALGNDLSLQATRRTLALQAQGVRVARSEFDPKLATRLATQRGLGTTPRVADAPQSQARAALDVTWLLASGATLKLSQNVDRQRLSGQPSLHSGSTSLAVAQPLLRGFGPAVTRARLANSESVLRVAVAGLERQAALVVVNSLLAYAALQQAQAAVEQAVQAQALALRVHELNQALVTAGRSARIVLLQSDSDVASARLGLVQAKNSERLAVRALAETMGRTDGFQDMRVVLAEDVASPATGAPPDEAALVRAALAQSPELLAAGEAVKVAQRELDLAENALLPALDLVASRNVPSGGRASAAHADTIVGLNFEVSFDRAPRELSRDAARAARDTALAQRAHAQRQVRDAASDALGAYRFALAQLELATGASRIAAQQQEAGATRQSLGQLSQLELSSAQRTVAVANTQLRDAKVLLLGSRLDVSRLAGTLLQTMNADHLVSQWIEQATQDP
jgi:outer membrane protein TolC